MNGAAVELLTSRPRRGLSIRARLILVVLAVAAPGVLVGLLTFEHLLERERNIRRDTFSYVARTILSAVESEVQTSLALANSLAVSPALLADDFAQFRKQADAAITLFPGLNIVVASPSGQQLVNTLRPADAVLPRRPQLDSQNKAFKARQPFVSDVYVGAVMGRPIATVEVPVFRDGDPYAVVTALLDPNRFAELLNAYSLPPGWLSAIIDRKGNFVARSRSHQEYVGKPASAGWRANMRREGWFKSESLEGDVTTSFNIVSPLSGWAVGVGASDKVLNAPIQQTMLWAGGAGGAVMLVGVLIAFGLSRRIVRHMSELENSARSLVADGSANLQSGVPDIERVWSALKEAVSGRQKFEAAMLESRDRLALAVSAGNFGIFDRDLITGHGVWDERVRQIWGFSPDEELTIEKLAAAVHPDDRKRFDETRASSTAPVEGHVDRKHQNEYRVINKADSRLRWINSFGRVTFSGGRAVRLVGVIIDVTERKLHEQHLEFVMRELSHRSKNLLAVVQSIARQTATQSNSFAEFNRKFVARIGALAAAHDILVKNDWIGGSIRDVVLSQLEPFEGKRCEVEGSEILIAPEAVQNIALAIHELATNAAKHGALSQADGAVTVTWAIESGDAARLRLTWRETGAPCSATAGREGFGTIVLRRVVPTALGATAHLERDASGMIYRLDIPLRWIAQETPIIGRPRKSHESVLRSPDEPLGTSHPPKTATVPPAARFSSGH